MLRAEQVSISVTKLEEPISQPSIETYIRTKFVPFHHATSGCTNLAANSASSVKMGFSRTEE